MTISPYFLTALRVRRILFLLLFGLWAGNGLAQSPHINYVSLLGAGPGTAVQIHGSGFTGVTAVHFGNVNAQSFTINQDTMINAIVGNGASGYISVWASGGVDSLAGFTFFPAATGPAIRTFTPGSGGPGTVVTIYGLRFTGATAVRFGGTAAPSFTVGSEPGITAPVG